jgi:hypothetical protein
MWVLLALVALLAIALALLFQPGMLTTDTAQHVSVARNLLAGRGFSTDLIYFQQHHDFGVVPAPQTVWPPLFPLATSLLMRLGVDALAAPFWVALLAQVCIAPTAYLIARSAGYAVQAAAWAAVAVFGCLSLAVFVLGGLTESLFTLMTLLSVLLLVRGVGDDHGAARGLWIWAGICAGLAYLTRYSGICLIAAFGLFVALRWLRERTLARFLDGLALAAIPVAIVVFSLVRNWLLTGSTSGGPNISVNPSLAGTVQAFYWALAKLFGLAGAPVWRMVISLALLILLVGLAWRVFRGLRTQAIALLAPRSAAQVGWWVSAAYVALSLMLIGTLSATRYPEFVTDRYLAPLWPVGVFVWLFAAAPVSALKADRVRAIAFAVGAVLFVGQLNVGARELRWYSADTRMAAIQQALGETIQASDGTQQTVRELLSGAATPIVETNGQYLGMLLAKPVIGFPETRFTNNTWDEAAALATMRRYGARYLVFFPKLYAPGAVENRNRPFFQGLHAGTVPAWLTPIHVSDNIYVFAIGQNDS